MSKNNKGCGCGYLYGAQSAVEVQKNEEGVTPSVDLLRLGFYALSDAVRLEIVRLLIDNEEMCACKFTDIFKISQPNLSFHLKILRNADIVKTRRKGTWMNYSINYDNILMQTLIPILKKKLENANDNTKVNSF